MIEKNAPFLINFRDYALFVAVRLIKTNFVLRCSVIRYFMFR